MYKVSYLDAVVEDLKGLDASVARRLLNKIEKTLAQDPKGLGKPLSGDFAGLWRYRIGDYRVIYKIADREILILVARIGHRSTIYN